MRQAKARNVVATLFATCVLAGTATAQEPQPREQPSQQPQQPRERQPGMGGQQAAPTEVMAERMTVTATIDKIDHKKRQISLKDEKGNEIKVDVPKEAMKNLESLKTGDKITVDYYSSVALSLQKGEKGAAPPSGEAMMERRAAKLPGGLVARKISATAEVVKVDTAANTVTIRGPTGEMDTIRVTDPAMQAELSRLSPGDRIHASYSEAVAVRVTPQAPQAKQKPEQKQQRGTY